MCSTILGILARLVMKLGAKPPKSSKQPPGPIRGTYHNVRNPRINPARQLPTAANISLKA